MGCFKEKLLMYGCIAWQEKSLVHPRAPSQIYSTFHFSRVNGKRNVKVLTCENHVFELCIEIYI